MTLLVTGAAGFIGAHLVALLRRRWPERAVVSFDALTYAGDLARLDALRDDPLHHFVRGDVADRTALAATFERFRIDGVLHLAAESHVDRSIVDPLAFVRTNVVGTATLLEVASAAWAGRDDVRLLHVSTDEVFGSLGAEGAFSEATPYAPRSPYAASKAAGDHLARAWHATYGLPVVLTHGSNGYGPYQFPEKLLPVVISRALEGEPVPVYGRGDQVRDWLHVDDHCAALAAVFERGRIGQSYCIGGGAELRNVELVRLVLRELERATGRAAGSAEALLRFVEDRPGHDRRYATDATRLRSELGWRPEVALADGLRRTVAWYVEHADWWRTKRQGDHRAFEARWYGGRLAGDGGAT